MTADIALIASYPPPFGGVANHVRRLSALLDERGVSHVIYNAVSDSGDGVRVIPIARQRTRWLLDYALRGRERVVYIFSDRLAVWLVGALMARTRGKRVIIRLRNKALPELMKDPKMRHLASLALCNVTRVIAVSQALAADARAIGVPVERIVHQPGFLPPTLGATEVDALSPSQVRFFEEHAPVIAANGKVGFHDGVDLYGLDHLVDLVGRLAPLHPRLGLAVSFWDHQPEDEPYLEKLRARARELGVEGHVLFHTESRPFVPALAKADVFVRPTCTDGDANSVREALYLGVPAIASDVVARPTGTILHRTRDLEDLLEKVRGVLDSPPGRSPNTSAIDLAGVERYVSLLRDLAR